MLVLTRKRLQTVRIGDDIVITVLQSGRNVRLGIQAPRDLHVLRGELEVADSSNKEPPNVES